MKPTDIKKRMPEKAYPIIESAISEFRPAQEKSINAGLLEGKNILVCTPTASGKTLIAELAAMKCILERRQKAVYIVPLKALATEKTREFKERYGKIARVALSIGDKDSSDSYLSDYDLIVTTSEKLDSLIRHQSPWIRAIGCIILDEVHLLNEPDRGPTLEVVITILRNLIPKAQIIALSATIGNPDELASWLDAKLVKDDWRPVKLEKGIFFEGNIEFD
ncbi:MAG TPA: DEAD/DEAH box helicase [Candidatus Nanoarchaeia archaeon]|nr:DEAD/DEAH box helicase [Candidatus Nanoarchaeia archaeon]